MTDTSAPEISIDQALPVPPYAQIVRQISDLINAGVLAEGTRLPPVRQLAADLAIAPGTVARAYQELEGAGLVQTSRGGGTRVAAMDESTHERRAALLAERAREYVDAARRLGVADDEALDAIRTALAPPTA